MPYVSDKQRRFFHSPGAAKAGIKPETVKEFDEASKGMRLPENVKKMADGGITVEESDKEDAKKKQTQNPEFERLRKSKDVSDEEKMYMNMVQTKHMADGGEIDDPLGGFRAIDEGDNHFMIEHPDGRQLALPKTMFDETQQEHLRNSMEPQESIPIAPNPEEASVPSPLAPEIVSALTPQAPAPLNPMVSDALQGKEAPQTGLSGPPVDELQKAWNQQLAGINQQATAQSEGQKQAAAIYAQQQQQMKETQDYYAKKRTELDAEQNQLQKDVMDSKVDPNHFWDSKTGLKGGASRVLSFLGLFLGGMSQAHTGVNPAQQMLQKAMEDDIDAQKANMNKKQNLLRMNYEKYGNLAQAENATRLDMANMFNAQLQQVAAQTQSQAVKANALQASGALNGQIAQMKHQLAFQDTMHKMMANTNGVPDALIPYLPKEQGQVMVKVGPNRNLPARSEKDAQDIRESQPAIDSALMALDDMEAGIRGYKTVMTPNGPQQVPVPKTAGEALPNFLGMAHLTPAGREGINQQQNVINAFRDVGKSPLRISEYANEDYLKELVPNPAQYSGAEALHSIQRLRNELMTKTQAARQQRLISYNPQETIAQFRPGRAK